MRRMLLPAAVVLIALTSCASDDQEELRDDLAAATADEAAPQVADSGEGEGPEEEEGERAVLEPAEVPTELVDPQGSVLGSAVLRDGELGTEAVVEVRGMTAGFHPMALYDVGTCDPDGAAPGEAFSSVGDLVAVLPPVLVHDNGVGALTTLVEPEPVLEELLVEDGTALVVYDAAPELIAQSPPAGSQLACAPFGPA